MRRNWTDTVKLHNARVRATQIALDKGELVRCRWCETPTANLGTRECDRCWELRHRIEQDPYGSGEGDGVTARYVGRRNAAPDHRG